MKPEYRAYALTLADGRVLQGIIKQETPEAVVLVDATGKSHEIAPADIEERIDVGSLMPANVALALPAPARVSRPWALPSWPPCSRPPPPPPRPPTAGS